MNQQAINEEEFCRDFNPMHYYKRLRELGFPDEEAHTMTHFYNEKVFTPTVEMYQWKHQSSQKYTKTKGKNE